MIFSPAHSTLSTGGDGKIQLPFCRRCLYVRTKTQCRFFPSLIETRNQAPVVQMADNAIHWINLYPLDSAIGFPNHPLDSDLSGFDRLPWPVDSAIQLLPNNWGQRSVWDRSHVNSE